MGNTNRGDRFDIAVLESQTRSNRRRYLLAGIARLARIAPSGSGSREDPLQRWRSEQRLRLRTSDARGTSSSVALSRTDSGIHAVSDNRSGLATAKRSHNPYRPFDGTWSKPSCLSTPSPGVGIGIGTGVADGAGVLGVEEVPLVFDSTGNGFGSVVAPLMSDGPSHWVLCARSAARRHQG